jgi:hypothetical protein
VIFGIIMGPHVSGLFDPSKWGGPDEHITDEITLEVTRVIIAVSVFAVGVELPKVSVVISTIANLRHTCGDIGVPFFSSSVPACYGVGWSQVYSSGL